MGASATNGYLCRLQPLGAVPSFTHVLLEKGRVVLRDHHHMQVEHTPLVKLDPGMYVRPLMRSCLNILK
jgi:hypothetical protein